MRRLLAFLLFWAISARLAGAEPPSSLGQNQDPPPQAKKKPDQPLLRDAFQAQFSKDQLTEFRQVPTLEAIRVNALLRRRRAPSSIPTGAIDGMLVFWKMADRPG